MPPVGQQYKKVEKTEIGQAMERKEQSINRFMDKKEQSIAIASSGRDACMVVTAKLQHMQMTDEEIKEEIKKWSKFFYAQYTSPF